MNDEESYRQRLSQFISKVPENVVNGSYNTAVQFKLWAGDATKALNNPNTKLHVLRALCIRYENFQGSKL